MNGGLSMAEMKSGYKMTEVGVIPEDWEVKELGDITKDMSDGPFGSNLKSCHYTNKKEVRIIQLSNIGTDGWSDNNRKYTTYKHLDTIRRCEVKSGNLVIAKMMPAGRAIICPSTDAAYVLSSDAVRVNLLECVNNNYAFYCTKSGYYLSQIAENTQGSTRARTSIKKLRNILFCMPDVKEQVAIATALSDVDSLISALTKKIEKKKAIKLGLMQQLLTGKKRLPGFNDKWKSMLLGDIAEVKDGTHQTPQYVKSGGKPFYSVENVTADDFKNVKHISLEEHKALTSNYRIEKGDVLMTRIGSIGCCKYVDWDVDASFYVSLALLKINEKYDSKFISYLSNIKSFKEEVMLNSLVFAIPQKINLGNISLIKVYIPTSKAEQTAIANILSDCDSEIAALEEKRDKYKEIKQGMMQQLLTGKIRLIK